MQIWVDADACPNVVKDILFRAAQRTKTQVTLVANHYLQTPQSPYVTSIQVAAGFDVADNEIVDRLKKGDLVITADIPLASDVIEKGGKALNPRGELYSADTIKARVTMRDFMETMRASGIQSGGPPPISQQDRQSFANELDKLLQKS